MIKDSNSEYDASGTRSSKWVKLKNIAQLSNNKMMDTLDLIPIGAYYGKGQRTGKFGAFLMASFNKTQRKFESVCKVGTGFSYQDLDELTQILNDQIIEDRPEIYLVGKTNKPDVWLLPNHTWEISADSLTRSPTY